MNLRKDTPEDTEKCQKVNLDKILVEEVGQCGRFQLRVIALLLLVGFFTGLRTNLYLFTFTKVNTRCYVPECESSSSLTNFSSPWIPDAIPSAGDFFDNCHRFANISDASAEDDKHSCSSKFFNRSYIVECQEYVYENTNSAVFDFNLACDSWRPNLVGSIIFVGSLLTLPIGGFIADRWGRRVALALTGFNAAWTGLMLYFAPTYISYILIGLISEIFGGAFGSVAFVLAVEYVAPQHRVLVTAALSSISILGKVVTSAIASTELHWRNLVLIIHCPMLIMLLYFWIVPESVRWLMSKNRLQKAETILSKAANINGNVLSSVTLQNFRLAARVEKDEIDEPAPSLIRLVFKHKSILLRCVIIPIYYLVVLFIDTGLIITSMSISGNPFLNYSLLNFASLPGYLIAVVLLKKIGRKPVIITSLWICGACQFLYIILPGGNYWLSLSVYFLGKLSVATNKTTLMVYNAELFPTRYRAQLSAFSVTIGLIGVVLSPLIPVLAENIWEHLPFVAFGSLAFLVGALVSVIPETFGTSLPDTMEEAADLGKGQDSGILKILRKLTFRRKCYSINNVN